MTFVAGLFWLSSRSVGIVGYDSAWLCCIMQAPGKQCMQRQIWQDHKLLLLEQASMAARWSASEQAHALVWPVCPL